MDGVLIDAKDWHYDALNRALNLFGYNISRYDHLVTFDGLPTRDKLEILSKEQGLPKHLHKMINELKQDYTTEIIHSKCKPIFNHEYALSRLKNEGYSIGLASNSIRQTIELMMDKSHLSQYLDITLSNEDVSKGKPDPEIYLKSAERLGIKTSDCLIVEDNPNGIAAAKASGAHVMVVETVYDVTYENIEKHLKVSVK